ncbi:DNA polymerase III subunit alpha [Pseudoclavibacter sp. VKM Ac-2867]|uniref:DNA polymerase III subunit alpha n=1 Tax=Pseudoclavibacter sp. VKM Ac-2867 TaxID=2783829 RepID=UPI00188A21EF|nr:DNA polymerase III subunit alpha [Pseudoclavibacter sp. VKM Ac-2867]MBF4459450.1 DNA polymerase III subunit alpha [Pseudoclavibacter sp. VKM Ac-2867]
MTDTSTAAPVPFANLHVHTEYSLLDGMASNDMFDHLASIGQNAVAVTDHGTLAGLWKMTEAGRKHGMKVLAGLESYVAVGSRFDRDFIEIPADDSSADEGNGKSGTGEKANTSDAFTLDQLSEEERARALGQVSVIETLLRSDEGDVTVELLSDYSQLTENSEAFRALAAGSGLGPAETTGETPVTLGDALTALSGLRATFLAPPRKLKKRFHEHLTLIATNETGWSNLLALSNAAELSKHQGKPRIDLQLLAEHHEGLVILTGCLGGAFLGSLSRGDRDRASDTLRRLVEIASTERVFVEVMEHGIDAESRVLPEAAALAAEHGVRVVATNDAHYVRPDADTAHAAWLAHQSKSTLANPKYAFHGAGFHLASEQEMRAKRPEQWWQDAVTTAGEIAALASGGVLPESKIRLPKFPLPDGETDTTAYFVRLINEGATRIYGPDRPAEVSARLQEEFNVVAQMGMTDYFLIVADMMAWARSQGILTGPGRGSAAGSMISYCLGIVTIDPLEHNLLFERFLEPGRKGMPDIDSDFEAARRDEVFAYLGRKYGNEYVARIGTFGFARTKKAIKDAARVLELTRVGDTLAKEVPIDGGKPLTFEKLRDPARTDAESFRSAVAVGGEDAARVVELAEAFEDLVSTLGVHACGFLVSDVPVAELVPVRVNEDGLRYTAWDGRDVEALGLCKIDILGLANLDGLAKAFEYLRDFEGIELAHDEIPHPNTKGDPRVDATYRLLREGKTSGVFQLESDGITTLTADIKPEDWDDLSAILALYRPGPMAIGMHQHYGARKHGLEAIDYGYLTEDPEEARWIGEVLGTTQGLMVMQEQIMSLGRVVAGFDAAERSKLRKAMGKKIQAEMDTIGLTWVQRATQEYRDDAGEIISPVFSRVTSERLWEAIKGNASYLFNASHSYAYARTTFDTAYVKANWPAAYGAALLATVDSSERRVRIIEGIAAEGIEVLPPHVNQSGFSTKPEGPAVRLGLGEIKDAGSDAEGLIRAREAHGGSFPDLPSIYRAIDPTANRATLGKRMLEALVEAGAMDEYGPRLGINVVSRALATAPFPVPQLEWSTLERAIRQRARIGISFGTHPLVLHQNEVRSWVPEGTMNPGQFRASLLPVQALPDVNGARISTLALLASVSTRAYRGGKLAQLTLEGSSARINGVMWNDRLAEHLESPQGLPPAGALVLARGKVSIREVEIEDRESGEVSTTIQRELTVSYLEEIRVADDGTYSLPEAPSMGIRFPSTEDPDVLAVATADAEATAAAQAAEVARLEQLQQAQLEVAAREAELAEHATVPLVDVRTGAAVPVVAVDANLSSAMVRLRLRNAGFAIDLDLAAQIAAGEVRVSELQGFPIRDDRTGDVVAYVVASPEEPTPDDRDARADASAPASTSAAHSAGEPADSTLLEGAIS